MVHKQRGRGNKSGAHKKCSKLLLVHYEASYASSESTQLPSAVGLCVVCVPFTCFFTDAPATQCANSLERGLSSPADVTHPASVIERDANPSPLQSLAVGWGGTDWVAERDMRKEIGPGDKAMHVDLQRDWQTWTSETGVVLTDKNPKRPAPDLLLNSWDTWGFGIHPIQSSPWRPEASLRALRRGTAVGAAHLLLHPLSCHQHSLWRNRASPLWSWTKMEKKSAKLHVRGKRMLKVVCVCVLSYIASYHQHWQEA